MARLSSHVLNGVDGSHAGGVPVSLSRLAAAGPHEILFAAETDGGGRLVRELDLGVGDPAVPYELVFATGPFWAARGLAREACQIVPEVVVRLRLPDPEGRYHVPVIISPNSCSLWWSS